MNLYKRIQVLYRARRYRLKVEPAEIAFLRGHLRPGQTAIDIGAHKGSFTYWMRRAVGANGGVYAFEPQPEYADHLRYVVNEWPMPNVTVIEAALSLARGRGSLHRPSGSPSHEATLERSANSTAFEVRVESLDEFFADQNQTISFIKCDVEGHELEVFKGGEQLLRRDHPVLLFECEQRHHRGGSIQPTLDFLGQIGYQGSFFQNDKLRPLAKFSPELQQDHHSPDYVYNFAFLPADGSRNES